VLARRIIPCLDVKDGRVVKGVRFVNLVDAGVAAIIYTDIERDGVLKGLNLEATARLARATSIPVIASGGLASIDDVKALLKPEYAMLEGAITGRALYDGRLDAREALALIAAA